MIEDKGGHLTLTSFDQGRSLRLPAIRVTATLPDRRVVVASLGEARGPAAVSGGETASPGGPENADMDRLGHLLELPLPEAREMVLEQLERSYVAIKLKQHGGNVSRAADAMGVSRQLVHRLIDRYNLKTK